jgi:SAM-dependent methyltransferase
MTAAQEYARVDATNADQAAAWDGEEGDDWTLNADRYDAACRLYDRHLIDAAQITNADDVLDVGCGTGISTRDAAGRAAAGTVTGIDLSARMVAEARQRSRLPALANTRFIHGDAQVYPFDAAAVDVVISRFGAMFFGDPVAAFANIGRAIRPGGRLALLSWRELAHNEWVLVLFDSLSAGRSLPRPPAGGPGPFGLAEEPAVRRILTAAGYGNIELREVNEPMQLGADVAGAFQFVSGLGLTRGLLSGLDEQRQADALGRLRDRLAEHATPDGVRLGASAWVITAERP